MLLPYQIKPNEQQIRWIAVLLSFMFSLLVIVQDEVINYDGALYLIVADLITQGEWQAAFDRYPWPFLSIVISFTSQVTGLIPEYAAHLLSMLFLAWVVVCFIDFVRLLGGDARTQMLAAVVILSLPYFNESRDEILRDHGYWLFYLLSVRFLFQHYRDPHLKWGLAWNVAIIVSCLFRMEGFVMMVLLPFVLLMHRGVLWKQRFIVFFQANVVSLLLLIVGLLLLPLMGDNLGRLGEFSSRLVDFWGALTIGLEQKADVIRQGVLPELSADFAMPSVVVILALIVVVKTVSVLSPVYSIILLLPPLYSRLSLPHRFWPFAAWVVLVNLVMLVLFILPTFFLQARFTMPLVLVSLLVVPFLLNAAWGLWQQKRNEKRSSRLFPAAMLVIMLMGAGGLISLGGYSKQYHRDAAEWIQLNSEAGSRIAATESLRFCYYINRNLPSNQYRICQFVHEPKPNILFDYLAVYVKKGQKPPAWAEYLEQENLVEVQKFENRRNDGIFIYQQNLQ